jgi:hypothetical protein
MGEAAPIYAGGHFWREHAQDHDRGRFDTINNDEGRTNDHRLACSAYVARPRTLRTLCQSRDRGADRVAHANC